MQIVAPMRFGALIDGRFPDLIHSRIYIFGVWEPGITWLITAHLRAGDTMIDIGANVGVHTLLAAHLVGTAGTVVAIEASPAIFQRLVANLRLNGAAQVQAVNTAVSDTPGRLTVFLAPDGNLGKTTTLGDFAELGVYRGNSAAVLAHYARTYGRQLYLFDTFEGFDSRDLTGGDHGRDLDFVDTSLDLAQHTVGVDSVRWIKGYFPASIPSDVVDTRFSVVHLDCDLYEPMKAGLEFFYPRLSPGGLLIIHDYANPYWEGIKQAVDELASEIPEGLVVLPDKSGTAMVRKARRV